MKALAVAELIVNFIKSAVLSGLETARVILLRPGRVRGGMTTLAYHDLSPVQASLVGALITLAPGTTTVQIDLERREFHLHLLDLAQREQSLLAIERDFIAPLRRYNGASR
jgi:multisubunit Na+/H+ antiporter MnhE subunit